MAQPLQGKRRLLGALALIATLAVIVTGIVVSET